MPRDKQELAAPQAAPELDGMVATEGDKLTPKHEGWYLDGLTEEQHAAKIAAERKA